LNTDSFKESIPIELVTHVTAICGERGEQWLDELPLIIQDLEREWNISVASPFPGIEYNFVAKAVDRADNPVVIKISPPFEMVEIFGEAKYLRLHDGLGAIRLLAEHRERRAILLERAVPGAALHEHFANDPIGCVDPAISALKRGLQAPPDNMSDVPTLDEWFGRFENRFHGTVFPVKIAERAIDIYTTLSKRSDQIFYLHGDFHPGNVVTATREEFLIIDPKGIVGHIGYDLAVFLINLERWQRTNTDRDVFLDEAIHRFATAFGISERETREWVFATMVIGAWWNFDDMPGLYDPQVAMPQIWYL
jgi:streptomycin 6-kinase